MISSWIWSCARRNGPSFGISQCEASVEPIDSLTTPRACAPVADAAASARNAAAAMASTCSRNLRPCAVSERPSLERANRGMPSWPSSSAILRPTVGWLERNRRAAAAKLRVSATATKVLHRSQSIGSSAATPQHRSFLTSYLFNIEQTGRAVQPYNGRQQAQASGFARTDALKSTATDAPRNTTGLARSREEPNAVARFACQFARTARGRIPAVHRVGARTRDRPVQGRHRRFVPRAQRPSRRKTRRVADADRQRTRRIQGAASGEESRALCGQPDLPRFQRPADEGHGDLREAQGPDHHYLAAATDRNRRGRAFLRRRGFP